MTTEAQPDTIMTVMDKTSTLGYPDFLLITSAASFAAEAHKNQLRKELGEPYIVHPLRVGQRAAAIGFAPWFIAACYLHDVIEDCNVTERTLRNAFPDETVDLVVAMSKWWDDGTQVLSPDIKASNYDAYYKRLADTDGGVNLKFLDRADNLNDFARMARLSPKAHKWASNYYKKTDFQFSKLYTANAAVLDETVYELYTSALAGLRLEVR